MSMDTNIYKNNEQIFGSSIEIRCILLALTAMAHNCPDVEVVSASFIKPDTFRYGWLSLIDWCIDDLNCEDDFIVTVRKKRDYFAEMVQKQRFDEYYWISIEIKNENNEEPAVYCLLAIDKDLKEVVITKGYKERMRFLSRLSSEYESAYRYGHELYNEIINKRRQ